MKRPSEDNEGPVREEVGASLPGSKYVRAYCHSCKEPIRVTSALDGAGDPIIHICDSCSGRSDESKHGVDKEDMDGFYLI